MNTRCEGSLEEPGKELESAQQEARTCPVCGTKFFATADREFCPVCILHEAVGVEGTVTGESGSASESEAVSAEEADGGGSQGRRFEHYEVMMGAVPRFISGQFDCHT